MRYVDNKSSSGDKTEALGQAWVTNVVHRVFRHLRPDEVDALSSKFSKESFKSGSTLIEQGTAGDRFYLIVDGVARTTNAQGQELSTSGPGGFVGEIAILPMASHGDGHRGHRHQRSPRRPTSPVMQARLTCAATRRIVAERLACG